MAGGTSGKSTALLMDAMAKLTEAKRYIQQIQQGGAVTAASGNGRHSEADPAIIAAIAALQALQ